MGAWIGSTVAVVPLGTYAVEALGLEEDSVVARYAPAILSRVWGTSTSARWVPKGQCLVAIWVFGAYLLLYDPCTPGPTVHWDLGLGLWPEVILALQNSGVLGGCI
jgi:hypothetical protein